MKQREVTSCVRSSRILQDLNYTASEAWNIAGCFRCTGLLIWFPSSLWAVSYRLISVTSITHPSHRPSLNYETPTAVWSVILDAGSRISLWQGAATDVGEQIHTTRLWVITDSKRCMKCFNSERDGKWYAKWTFVLEATKIAIFH